MEDDPILERIHHQLFHLVEEIRNLAQQVKLHCHMTDELTIEVNELRHAILCDARTKNRKDEDLIDFDEAKKSAGGEL